MFLGAETPFWLQVASIAIAPVLGVAGVGYGARWAAAAQQQHWRRDEQRRAYARLLAGMHRLNRRFGVTLRGAARDEENKDVLESELVEAREVAQELDEAVAEVRLVGSRSVRLAAAETYRLLHQWWELATTAQRDGYDDALWLEQIRDGLQVIENFQKAAWSDLGTEQ